MTATQKAAEMAAWNGWKCLAEIQNYRSSLAFPISRLSNVLSTSRASASFSTTTRKAAADRGDPPKKGTSTLRIAKAIPVNRGKPPEIGERKAMRKRIVLRNDNALEVEMPNFDARMIEALLPKTKVPDSKNHLSGQLRDKTKSAEKKRMSTPEAPSSPKQGDVSAKIVGLQDQTVDALRAAEAFKITQSWELFRRPAILIRKESKILTQRLVQAQQEKSTLRMVIDGSRGAGKSMMLLHAMATALLKDWLVINIPEARNVTNAVTEYSPIRDSDLWSQSTLSAELLTKIAKTNSELLEKMEVKQTHAILPIPVGSNISLYRLCELGAREPEVAWSFFLALWSEITAEGRPPVIMCLDGLTFILQNSLYRYPDLSFIHSQDLAIVRHFADYLSGAKTLPNGSAIIAATSRSSDPGSKSLDLAVRRAEERANGLRETERDPYEKKYDVRSDKLLATVDIMKLGGLSKDETRGLMEYWAKSGILKSRVDSTIVAEKWALAGHGNAGEIQRGSLLMHI